MSIVRQTKVRGAALIVALILLLIVTLLATTGMSLSVAELAMAGNEQLHRQAVDAASAGVEAAIARLAAGALEPTSSISIADTTASGSYFARARYVGDSTTVPGFSAGQFSAQHFEIESIGEAARGASDDQLQGVMVVSSTPGVASFVQREGGLTEVAP
ncbi:MAG TPA: PilX N-terminal domain-containing pilus assembly protein [Steroidobacteraceae bacterium]|jgi:Tfp pilus assembly protein PilX|nr:PilX N-terminal domain-containing pilus assembly protein [Steroidobacteraceae bacterium]